MIRDATEAGRVLRAAAGTAPGHRGVANSAGLAAAGGIIGGLAASACCIVPLILFSLGVGGVWVGRLAALSPYQPVFIGFATIALGYGFWQVYRRPETICAEGGACARPLPRRFIKAALWSATGLVTAALLYPYAVPYLL